MIIVAAIITATKTLAMPATLVVGKSYLIVVPQTYFENVGTFEKRRVAVFKDVWAGLKDVWSDLKSAVNRGRCPASSDDIA